jgi:hypothetical protein
MSHPLVYRARPPKRPGPLVFSPTQRVVVDPNHQPCLVPHLTEGISVLDAKRLRNWLSSYIRWERALRRRQGQES